MGLFQVSNRSEGFSASALVTVHKLLKNETLLDKIFVGKINFYRTKNIGQAFPLDNHGNFTAFDGKIFRMDVFRTVPFKFVFPASTPPRLGTNSEKGLFEIFSFGLASFFEHCCRSLTDKDLGDYFIF